MQPFGESPSGPVDFELYLSFGFCYLDFETMVATQLSLPPQIEDLSF